MSEARVARQTVDADHIMKRLRRRMCEVVEELELDQGTMMEAKRKLKARHGVAWDEIRGLLEGAYEGGYWMGPDGDRTRTNPRRAGNDRIG